MHIKTQKGLNLKFKPLDFMSINNSLQLTKNYTLTINIGKEHLVTLSIACKTDVTINIFKRRKRLFDCGKQLPTNRPQQGICYNYKMKSLKIHS